MKKIVIFILLTISFLQKSEANQRDSLCLILKNETNKEILADTYFNLASTYIYENGDSARFFYRRSISLDKEIDNWGAVGSAYKHIGMTYIFQDLLDSAILQMKESLRYYERANDTLNVAFIHNNLGLLNVNNGDYATGVDFLIKSLECKESLVGKIDKKKLKIGSTELNIGIAFQNMHNLDKALEYYKKAEQTYLMNDNQDELSRAYMQLANVYYEMDLLGRAEEYSRLVIQDSVFISNKRIRAKLFNNFGVVLLEQKKYKEAESIINQAYELNMATGNEFSAAKNLNNLADLSERKNHTDKVIYYASEAYKIAEKYNNKMSLLSASEKLSAAYAKKGAYQKSIKYYQLLSSLKDSVYNVDKNRIISDMEAKYDSEKKEQEIEVLNAQQKVRDLEIKQKSVANRWITAGLILLTIVLILIIRILRKVRMQKEQLAELNKGLQKMFAIVSHDIRNFVNGFKSTGSLLEFYIKEGKNEKLSALPEKLNSNAKRLDGLLDNLLNWAVAQSGLYKPEKSSILISELINAQINLVEDVARLKGIEIQNTISSEEQIQFDSNNLNFVIRNLLSNSIKYTENGKIIFKLENKGQAQKLVVEDTGVGIADEKLNEIFTFQKGGSQKGTAGEKGSGLGLKLVRDFVKLNNANIEVESEIGKGTKFIININ